MNLRQENIIKDKLLEYEVPFEEKYWKDFQEKQGLIKSNRGKYYGMLILALLSLSSLLLLKSNNSSGILADNGIESIINDFELSNSFLVANDKSIIKIKKLKTDKATTITNRVDERDEFTSATINDITFDKNISNNSINYDSEKKDEDISSSEFSTNLNKSNLLKTPVSAYQSVTEAVNVSSQSKNVASSHKIENSSTINKDQTINSSIGISKAKDSNLNSDNAISDNYNSVEALQANDIITSKKEYLDKHVNEITKNINALVALDKIGFLPPNNDYANAKNRNDEISKSDEIDWELKKQKNWEIRIQAGLGLNIPVKNSIDGIESSLINENDVIGGGPNLALGLTYVYQLNSKVNLETGFVFKRISNIFAAEYNWEDNSLGIAIEEASVIEKLNSFELPFGVNVKMTSWLYFSGGFSLAYVRPTAITFPEAIITNLQDLPEDYINSKKLLANMPNYGINRIDVRAYAGLSFNVSPYIAFRMIVNQGLLDRTNSTYYNKVDYDVHTDYTFSAIIRLNPKVIK